VLPVHFGESLVENRERHSRWPPILRIRAAVDRRQGGADRDVNWNLLLGARAGAAPGFPPRRPARDDILHVNLEGTKISVLLELAEILLGIFEQDLDLAQRIAVG